VKKKGLWRIDSLRKFYPWKFSLGFTLIELLVIIAIIGVLVGSLLAVLNPKEQISKSHDAQRKSDLNQIRTTLDTYYGDHNRYPPTLADIGSSYTPRVAQDPLKDQGYDNYCYETPSDGSSYLLSAKLERDSDPQATPGIKCKNDGIDYNYAITSSNTSIAAYTPTDTPVPPPPAGSTPTPTPSTSIFCGDGIKNGTEKCDGTDGVPLNFTCTDTCTLLANLLLNEDFESPVVTAIQKWDIYDSGVAGWNVDWYGGSTSYKGHTRPAIAKLEIHAKDWPDFTTANGNQYIELDSDWDGPAGSLTGEPASVTIWQNVATNPGKDYELKFSFAPRPNTVAANNNLEVRWDGNPIPILTTGPKVGNPGQTKWQDYTYTVTATGYSTRLSFTDLGTPDSLGTFLDNISLRLSQ
jgi:type II secretory pathway pseudopilin PulG